MRVVEETLGQTFFVDDWKSIRILKDTPVFTHIRTLSMSENRYMN